MPLTRIRAEIDAIDDEILDLLQRRLQLALKTRPFKARVGDRAREAEIIGGLDKRAQGYSLLRTPFLVGLFEHIFKESRRIQRLSRR